MCVHYYSYIPLQRSAECGHTSPLVCTLLMSSEKTAQSSLQDNTSIITVAQQELLTAHSTDLVVTLSPELVLSQDTPPGCLPPPEYQLPAKLIREFPRSMVVCCGPGWLLAAIRSGGSMLDQSYFA